MQYDNEEKFIIDALEADTIELSTPSKKEIAFIKSAANNTLKKKAEQPCSCRIR